MDFCLYRDDGLGYYKKGPGPSIERLRKDIIKLFKDSGLNITIESNMSTVNFLDVTFNLEAAKYRPYKKPNDQLLYIHKESNHPPTVKRQLPSMIQQRLSELSTDENEFNQVKGDYESALKNSGFGTQLKYSTAEKRPRNRKRNIIWFNPPFNSTLTTNLGKQFLALITKHFPQHHKFSKIFNRNTVKLSYSGSPNMKSVISSHN